MGAKKNFVLDTNVILHDYKCIHNFEENDIYIPIIVLEELDKFKKGNDQINYNAREFVRELDDITESGDFNKGFSLGENQGRLFIITNFDFPTKVKEALPEKKADNTILATAYDIAQKQKGTKTILVSKDVNMRMKARALGIPVEDYINDKVTNADIFSDESYSVVNVDGDLIDQLYSTPEGLDIDKFDFKNSVAPNECFILKSERSSILARKKEDKIIRVSKKEKSFGIEARNTEQAFALNLLNDKDISLIAITGKAGTGKTLLALAAALQQQETYKQILLARPIVSLSNKEIGFLPGNEKEKIAPYMQPLFDNLNVIKNQFSAQSKEIGMIQDLQTSGKLVIEALAYIRGRSLSETIFIVDEAQNLTPHEIKTIITRAAEGSKFVVTGDIHQIDTPYLDMNSNGLVYMIDKMKDQDIFAHINLVKGERSYLAELASDLL
ncbi:MAG: PhoH family protein [Paludibacteraceae bacterium]|nr:PhoH family protein [Paludibacteraceae bacterium]